MVESKFPNFIRAEAAVAMAEAKITITGNDCGSCEYAALAFDGFDSSTLRLIESNREIPCSFAG